MEQLISDARASIGDYCMDVCKSFCCQDGVLIVRPDEIDEVMQGKKEEFLIKGLLKKNQVGNFELKIGTKDHPCPSLSKDFKCLIFDNPKRPVLCRNFPIFQFGKQIILAPRCPAIKAGKLEPFLMKLKELGYNIK